MVVPVGLFAAGVACIAAAVLTGEAEVSLFLIFPVFSGSSGLFLLGTALIVFSFIAGFVLLMKGQLELAGENPYAPGSDAGPERRKTKTGYGGVVFVGPVPIAFGSDKTMALAMLMIGVVFAVVALVLLLVFAG